MSFFKKDPFFVKSISNTCLIYLQLYLKHAIIHKIKSKGILMKKIVTGLFLSLSLMFPAIASAQVYQLDEPAVFMTKKTGVVKIIKQSKRDKDNSIITLVFLNEDQMGISLPLRISKNLKVGSIIQLFIQENRVYSINILNTNKTEISKEFLESLR